MMQTKKLLKRIEQKAMYADMAISAVNTALDSNALQAQYQVAVAKKGMDAQRFLGDSAVKLIQSASIDPSVGRNLNVSA